MPAAVLDKFNGNARRHAAFVAFILASALVFWKTLSTLVEYSLHNDSSSHIILIPLVAFSLLYIERKRVFSITGTSIGSGIGLALGGVILYWLVNRKFLSLDGNESFSLETFSIILVWVGGFIVCYGLVALRAAAFPLLFLLLMIPLPDRILDRAIHALQEGSTEFAYFIFQAVGTPVLRQGFLLSVPGVTVEVAKECSSIRSSIALFITCLLAAHLYLRTPWKMALFALLALPLAVLKNGIRIVTLTLLSIHVDPSFLTGNLHHKGGFVFFLLALLILWPVLLLFEKSENPRKAMGPAACASQEPSSD
jgi:exosortase